MRFEAILAGVVLQVGSLLASCHTTATLETHPGQGGYKATVSADMTSVLSPAGGCVKLVFLGEDGQPIQVATGTPPLEVPTPPGTARTRLEPCDQSHFVVGSGRAPKRGVYPYLTIPAHLDLAGDRFLAATVRAYSAEEAASRYAALENGWTAFAPDPLVKTAGMVEVEFDGNEILLHVYSEDDILRLDLEWNGQPYATLADATIGTINGWHRATFRIPAADVRVPAGSAPATNSMSYVMDTVKGTGLTFRVSAEVES